MATTIACHCPRETRPTSANTALMASPPSRAVHGADVLPKPGHDVRGEPLHVPGRLLVPHRAELEKGDQHPDARAVDVLSQPLGHGLRAPQDDLAVPVQALGVV